MACIYVDMEMSVKRFAWALFAVAAVSSCRGTETSLIGTITDARCGGNHDWDEHGPVTTERECILMCIKSGARYVLVSGRQVHAIANQDHPGLAEHAGREARVTGRMNEDALTISGFDTTP